MCLDVARTVTSVRKRVIALRAHERPDRGVDSPVCFQVVSLREALAALSAREPFDCIVNMHVPDEVSSAIEGLLAVITCKGTSVRLRQR